MHPFGNDDLADYMDRWRAERAAAKAAEMAARPALNVGKPIHVRSSVLDEYVQRARAGDA